MRILFDLTGTIFGAIDASLRPGIKETIECLRACGADVRFWTGGQRDYYSALLRKNGIEGDVLSKHKPLPFVPDLCVDDEDLPLSAFKVYKVAPHIAEDLPGSPILVAEILFSGETDRFFWD